MLTMHCVDCWHLASSEVRFEEKMSKKEVAENLLRSSLGAGKIRGPRLTLNDYRSTMGLTRAGTHHLIVSFVARPTGPYSIF